MNYFLKYAAHGKLVAGLICFKRKSRPCASKVYIQFNENRKLKIASFATNIGGVLSRPSKKSDCVTRQTPRNRKHIQYSD